MKETIMAGWTSEESSAVEGAAAVDTVSPNEKPNHQKIRVLLADDQAVLRKGLIAVLGTQPDFEVVAEASDGLEAVRLTRLLEPDVVLMDYRMPRLDGVEATRLITADSPGVRVIGFSSQENRRTPALIREAGAVAYVVKGEPMDRLIEVIRHVFESPPAESPTERLELETSKTPP